MIEKWLLAFFPSLKRRGGRDINKKFPFRSEAVGVVSSAKHFAELTTPAAPFRWLRVFLLVRSHPSFSRSIQSCPAGQRKNTQDRRSFLRGESFMPTLFLLYSNISFGIARLESLVQKMANL